MEDPLFNSIAIVCAECEGDPRRSATCKLCRGAGVGVPSPDGFLVWSESVDEISIMMRKLRRRVRTIFHFFLFAATLLCFVFVAFHVSRVEDLALLGERAYWLSGRSEITILWFGILLGCFLFFRLSEYTKEARPLPNWSAGSHEAPAAALTTPRRFDIEPYFSPEARDIVEGAYTVAKSLGRVEVTPHALFASALASPMGSLFLLRLGMTFEKVKTPLAKLLVQDPGGTPPIRFSRDAKRTLALAYAGAYAHHRKYVTPIEVFLQSFHDSSKIQELLDQLGFLPESVSRVAEWIRLAERLREDHERFAMRARLKPKTVMNRAMTARQTPLLDRLSEDLTLSARDGFLAPAIGREREMEELLRAIESGRQSVVLVGERGSGKMALVEHLARRMVEEEVPPELFDRRLVAVDIAKVLAAGDPGLAAERFLAILQEASLSGNIILALIGIEALAGAGLGGPMDLAEIFASELEKGYFLAIATTTPHAWTEFLERRSLGAKLVKVDVPEMGVEETLTALMARAGGIEYSQGVFFSFTALAAAARLADRYLHHKAAPEKTLELIREAAVLARKSRGEKTIVTAEDVAKIVQEKTHIPIEAVTTSESEKLLNLEARLHRRVIGQDEAVIAVSRALRRARAELQEGKRPIANFLFLGPTGVGKTELAKALSAEYFGSEDALIRLDMSEYQDPTSVARVIGAPGDERGGLLTEAVRQKPFSIVLLDELEKAHADILNLFLQVMDDGRLTDGVGRTIDFTNTMLIATSNAGTQFIQDEVALGTPLERIKTGLLERELKGVYRPEFLNRFDGIIVFAPLTLDQVTQIAWLFIRSIAKRLEAKGITFTAADAAVEELARAGFDPLFGARPLRRVIQDRVDTSLADLLLQHKLGRKDLIALEADGTLRVSKAPVR